jgi:hypothetical protein
MWFLHLLFISFVLGIVNFFQWAAAILAKQTGRDFWRWYWIAQVLPGISLIILLLTWDSKKNA